MSCVQVTFLTSSEVIGAMVDAHSGFPIPPVSNSFSKKMASL
jgi:hypothetical protein